MSSDNKNIDLTDYQTAAINAYGYATSDLYNTYYVDGPSVLDKYPITNKSWWKFEDMDIKDKRLKNVSMNVSAIHRYMSDVRLLREESFFAKLEDVRPKTNTEGLKMGFTYDPWYRCISEHRHEHYSRLSYAHAAFDAEKSYMITAASNSQELVLFWGFHTTIEKVSINLFLYTFATFAYVDKRQKENHMNMIHPYNCSTAENYDLMNKYTGPYTGISGPQYSTPMPYTYSWSD